MRTRLAMFLVSTMLGNNDLIGMNDLIGVSGVVEKTTTLLSYRDARTQALATGQDLVIGVGCNPPQGEWIVARSEDHVWDGTQHWVRPYVAVCKNKGKHMNWLRTFGEEEATVDRIRALLLPPDPRDEAQFKQERAAPSFPKKYNPRFQENFQDKMDNQKRIRRQTSNLRLVSPRYVAAQNC